MAGQLTFGRFGRPSSAFGPFSAAAPALTATGTDSSPRVAEEARPSFEAVYHRHVGFVWRTLRRLGIPAAELEDAVQDVFLILHRRLDEFDPTKASMPTWLYGMARGIAANRRRKAARGRRPDGVSLVPSSPLGPEQHAERAEAERVVGAFLDTLSPERRAVFELCEVEGLRGSEIAKILELNVNTVHTRIRAVRALFKTYLAQMATGAESGVNRG
ncbi:MAG: sigma-70 family RNA polymerase sigma factor [Myxococcales bacterium FL481]|nr:MAG: sigma-70 family RNA polymerase sigma factor [Myxococcales bacterium FL481]